MQDIPTYYLISYCQPATATRRRKTGWYELDMEQSCHRKQIVSDIAGWAFEDIDKVFEAADGRWNDVTEDIAREVLSVACEDSVISWELKSWLHEVLGCDAVDEVLAEDQMEDA